MTSLQPRTTSPACVVCGDPATHPTATVGGALSPLCSHCVILADPIPTRPAGFCDCGSPWCVDPTHAPRYAGEDTVTQTPAPDQPVLCPVCRVWHDRQALTCTRTYVHAACGEWHGLAESVPCGRA